MLATTAALTAALAWAAPAQAQSIAAERLSEDRVDVAEVQRASPAGKTYDAVTIIAAPVAELCAIVQDYGAYPAFMPNTAGTTIVSSEDGHAVIDMTLSLPLGKSKRYRLQLDAKRGGDNCQLSWKLVARADLAPADTIADTSGYWMFTPLPANHGKSVVEYYVYADPGPVPFGLGWIVDIMSKKSLPDTLEALRGRARKP
ncbi:SRPBCC family protein [Rugamonas sp.]|uniref:SRPBCC family protein n=1 Tax=Rugamonas sp. TaxID=1926287 RepID=UPI0025CFE1F6|nr:SRPBCC family protein [Rugamonas sp.]